MTSALLQGAALGFTAGVAPGPLQAYLLSQALRHGWRHAALAALAPIPSDAVIIAAVWLLLSRVPGNLIDFLQLAGGLLLVILGVQGLRPIRDSHTAHNRPQPIVTGFLQATLLNVLNPNPWLFWASIGGPLLIQAWRVSPVNALGFLIGFHMTFVGSMILLAFLSASVAGRAKDLARGARALSAAVLICFGLYQVAMLAMRLG